MRALVLLSICGLCIWAVVRFFPRDDVQGGEPPREEERATVVDQAPAPEDGPEPEPSAPSPGSLFAEAEPDAVELGAAILHGGAASVETYLRDSGIGIDGARGRLALAFCEALEGRRGRAAELASQLEADSVTATERDCLARALGQAASRVLPASSRSETPVELALLMRLEERQAQAHLDAGEMPEAAGLLSRLLLAELGAPWDAGRDRLAAWTREIKRAQGAHRWNPRSEWPAIEHKVLPGENLTVIRQAVVAANPGLRICTGLIERANRLEGRYLQRDAILRIPTDPVTVLVDLDARWVLYLMGGEVAEAWEVGVGKEGHETYLGDFIVGDLQPEPMWFPGPGIDPVPYGHEDNPLGTHWVGWNYPDGVETSLGFHGTNEPDSIGQAASQGCIRMRNEDVERLYKIIPRGTPVRVQP